MISEDTRLAVKKGSYWLDTNHPGWAERLNLSTLVMWNSCNCVIGQAVGDYYRTVEKASGGSTSDFGKAWATEHGFATETMVAYLELEEAWTEEVNQRR